jgi:ankyrin repeat protein
MASKSLLEAAAAGGVDDYAAARRSLPEGQQPVDVTNEKGQHSLHIAADQGHSALVQHLLDAHGFDASAAPDAEGARSGQQQRAGNGCRQWRDDLGAQLGASTASPPVPARPPARPPAGNTPLALAVGRNHAATVGLLLARGADASATTTRGPLLMAACAAGAAESAAALLAAGADASCASPEGMPALFMAAAMAALKSKLPGREAEAAGAARCMEVLLRGGADPSATAPGGFTPLHVAAEAGAEGMLRALLAAGADTSARTAEGQTPAAVAASWGHRDAAALLLRHVQQAAPAAGEVDALVAEQEAAAAARREANAAAAAAGAASPVPSPEQPDEAAAEALKAEGNAAFAAGRYDAARGAYRAALRHWTASAPLWANAAAAALKVGEREEALRCARCARAVDPRYVKAWYREGTAAEGLYLWEDAAAAYFEAHLLAPEGSGGLDFGEMVRAAAERGRLAVREAKERDEAAEAAAAAATEGAKP